MGGEEQQRAERARVAVAAMFFVNGATVGSWVPHIPGRAASLHLQPAQLGATLLAGGVGCMAAMPLSSRLTRRFGSRRVCLAAGLLFPLVLTIAIAGPARWIMAAGLFCGGITGATNDVAMNAHGVLVEKHLRRRTVSLLHGLFSAGCVAGSAVTSLALAHRVPPVAIALSLAAALACVVWFAGQGMLRDGRGEPYGAAPGPAKLARSSDDPSGTFRRGRKGQAWGRLLLLGVLTFSAMVSEGAIADWSALLLRVTRGLGAGVAGYGFTAFSATMVVGRLTGDRVVARIGEVWALRCGGLLAAGGLAWMLAGHALGSILAGFAVAGLGLSNASPILYRAAGRLPSFAPETAIAVAVGVGYGGLLAGPPFLGFVAQATGLRSIFYILMAFSCVLAAAAGLARPGSALAPDPRAGSPASVEVGRLSPGSLPPQRRSASGDRSAPGDRSASRDC